MVKRILSLGAGVNSTAVLCLGRQGRIELDAVIFADTGGEYPQTYWYINTHIKPLCKEMNLPLITVSKGNLRSLQIQLGHADLSTTAQYLLITLDDVKEDFDKVFPSATEPLGGYEED